MSISVLFLPNYAHISVLFGPIYVHKRLVWAYLCPISVPFGSCGKNGLDVVATYFC